MTRLVIAAGTKVTAEAGTWIAEQGGNAVDAAIAAAIVSMCTDIGIMSPGGGAFIAVWPKDSEPVMIDGYAAMPGYGLEVKARDASTHRVTFDYGGETHQQVGYGTIATPGAFAGFALSSQRFGKLPWEQLLTPAITWAEKGFPLTGGAAEYLLYTHEAIYSWHPESSRIIHHADGSPLQQGEIVHIPYLADTLKSIAADPDALYRGELGRHIASAVRDRGGLLGIEDLEAYQAIARAPIMSGIGEWEVATNPPPAIGGACLASMLLLLDRLGSEYGTDDYVHQMIIAQRAVLGYRAQRLDGVHQHLAAEVERLLEMANKVDPDLLSAPSTSHVSTIDSDQLACAITASAGYGSGAMIEGTGLWLNNSLGELDLHAKGLAHLNPGTRLASNMAPTLARRKSDDARLAIGSPGASRITTAIAQVLTHFSKRNMDLKQAVDHPRLHVELANQPQTIAFEPGLPVIETRGMMPRPFSAPSMYFGGVQAVVWPAGGDPMGVADARRGGYVARF